MSPVSAVMTTSIRSAGMSCANMVVLLGSDEVQRHQHHIDQLDADEREQYAAHAINQHVPPQHRTGADGTVLDSPERQRDQGRDDESVKNDRRENGAVRRR